MLIAWINFKRVYHQSFSEKVVLPLIFTNLTRDYLNKILTSFNTDKLSKIHIYKHIKYYFTK